MECQCASPSHLVWASSGCLSLMICRLSARFASQRAEAARSLVSTETTARAAGGPQSLELASIRPVVGASAERPVFHLVSLISLPILLIIYFLQAARTSVADKTRQEAGLRRHTRTVSPPIEVGHWLAGFPSGELQARCCFRSATSLRRD